MRHANTRERKLDRIEFVYLHREEFKQYSRYPGSYYPNKAGEEWVDKVARVELGYNPKTNSCDIWCSLHKCYMELVKRKIIV